MSRDTMRAAVYERYGPPEVIRVKDISKPLPKENEVLIRVSATTLNSADVRLRKADPFLVRLFFGLTKPNKQVLGVDIAGVVEKTGSAVTKFKTGDAVFGSTFDDGLGAHAEYVTMSEDSILSIKPENVSFGEAAALFFGGHSALHFLRKGEIGQNKNVLVYGASGALGTHAVQIARYYGAEVHGVCSTKHVDLVTALGASRVYDYTKEDFSQSGEEYDILFDTVGKSPFAKSVRALKKDGFYCRAVHTSIGGVLKGLWVNLTSGKKVIGGVATERLEDFLFLRDLLEKGMIKPVIDRTYPLEDIVEAHRYVEKGHKKGNVVISVKAS